MASDPERRKRIREAVTWLRGQKIEPGNDGQPLPFDSNAEHYAYIAECCRAEGHDEAETIEIVLTALSTPKEDLLEADSVLRPLGYKAISSVLRRLARRAPARPPSRWEQRKLRFEDKSDTDHRMA
jgi:hypothetical protein